MLQVFLLAFVALATGSGVSEWMLGLEDRTWQQFAVKTAVFTVLWMPGWYFIVRRWRREAAEKSGR